MKLFQRNWQIRRAQWVIAIAMITIIATSILLVMDIFESSSFKEENSYLEHKVPSKSLTTLAAPADMEAAWRYKLEEELKAKEDKITLLEDNLKNAQEVQEKTTQQHLSQLEGKLSSLEQEFEKSLQEGMKNVQEERLKNKKEEIIGLQEFSPILSGGDNVSKRPFKVTIALKKPVPKEYQTIRNTIPAGTFVEAVLLSGVNASTALSASANPQPLLLRLIGHGTLPKKLRSDLKDCHCVASCYGDLNSERIYARLEKLSCVERVTGEIIETQVSGYIAGEDGKTGIRGTVISKEGAYLSRAFMGGLFSGFSSLTNPDNKRLYANPFSNASTAIESPTHKELFTTGLSKGASSALDRLSSYYIDRAEQLQPVIQVPAGQKVVMVFTSGAKFGSDTVHRELSKVRETTRQEAVNGEESSKSSDYINPFMLKGAVNE